VEASPGKGRWIAAGKTERFSIAALLRVSSPQKSKPGSTPTWAVLPVRNIVQNPCKNVQAPFWTKRKDARTFVPTSF
jgi:hypothetical protein